MHASPLLHRWLRRACPAIHAVRTTAVVAVVDALLLGGKLTLTHLGRNLRSAAFAKHSIKRVDRLLGNRHLHRERPAVYRAVARWVLAATPRPILLVDWADCAPGHRWLLLRAAVPLGGRAIPVYEEVHPLARYNSPRTHRRFLRNLHALVPDTCAPILVTDAGFRGPWFRVVPRGRALRVGLDRARPEQGQVPARRRGVGVHDGPVCRGDPDPAASRRCSTLAPRAVRVPALPGPSVPARPGPAAQGARAGGDGTPLPQAPQGPLAARDLAAARPPRGAERGPALRPADEDRGRHPRHQERALGLRPVPRPLPAARAPGDLAADRRAGYAGVLALRPRGRGTPVGATLSSEHRAQPERAVDGLRGPPAAHQPPPATVAPRAPTSVPSAPRARRALRECAVISWGYLRAQVKLQRHL